MITFTISNEKDTIKFQYIISMYIFEGGSLIKECKEQEKYLQIKNKIFAKNEHYLTKN